MATPFDVGLLGNFKIIFPFLFIFCIVFGVLAYTKLLGENKILHAMIAIVLAFMSLFSDIVIETINTAAPWFVIMIIFTVFVLLGFMIIGIKEGDIVSLIKNPEYTFISWWIVALVAIIVIGSFSHVIAEKKGGYPPFGESNITADDGTGEVSAQESDFWNTLFHPKVLGMLALLLIGFFPVSRLTSST